MPNIDPCRNYDELERELIVSMAYNKFIEDKFPIDQPSSGAWQVQGELCILPTRLTEPDYKDTAFVDQDELDVFIIDSPRNQDPITQENLLNNEEDQVQELIFRIKTSKLILYRKNLANRLLDLYHDAKEEDPECVGISAESLRSFNDFIHLHTNLNLPTISLTPDCNIYASWRDNHNRVFSIHFLPNADVRFVLFKPNEIHLDRKIRISGSATIDTVMETLAPHCLEEWISE